MQATALGLHDATDFLDFDGHGECLIESPEVLQKLIQDPYFKEEIKSDEDKLIDKTKTMRRVGWEEVFIQNGKAV